MCMLQVSFVSRLQIFLLCLVIYKNLQQCAAFPTTASISNTVHRKLALQRYQHAADDDLPGAQSRRALIQKITSDTVLISCAAAVTANPFSLDYAQAQDIVPDKPASPGKESLLKTVRLVPDEYFIEHKIIYGFMERVMDGDTVRVRHVPNFSPRSPVVPESLSSNGSTQGHNLANETLVLRLYGIDCPEIAKNKNQTSQPFAKEAKQFTSDLTFHKMVKVTFLKRDRYGRALAVLETVPMGSSPADASGIVPRDLSIELVRNGLAEMYTGAGADYYTRKVDIKNAVSEAKDANKGIWSLGEDRVSASEVKRILRNNERVDMPRPALVM